MEQYRIRPKRKFKSLLTGDDSGDHHFIPYPNDPPHTFPSIKARAFVKIFFFKITVYSQSHQKI
jgi:hypothetical protein